jgi:hypothetical protein
MRGRGAEFETVSAHARRFVAAASVLGGSFRLGHVGEILDESPGALLAISPRLATSTHLIIGRPPPAGIRPHPPAKPLQDYPA